MNDKDKQLEELIIHLTTLQTQAQQQSHQLMALQVHAAQQDERLERLMALVGLLQEDVERPDALTQKDKSLLLRVRRALN